MMKKSILKYLFPLILLSGACAKEKEAPVPEKETLHYRADIEAGDATRALLGDDMSYTFERGDRVYMESADGRLYGFLSLSQASDAGKSLALFEGDLTCEDGFRPDKDTQVTLVLVGRDDAVHTLSDDGKLTGVDYGNQWAESLSEAVRRLSHFTGSGKFGDLRFTLSQQSSFVVFSLSFNAEESFTASLYNGYSSGEPSLLFSDAFVSSGADGDFEASWVLAFAAGTELSDARVVVSRDAREDLALKMADASLAANTYYSFQRATFMQDYLVVEAREAGTTVSFNKASGNGVQYSLDGYDWVNYQGAVTLASAGDKIYFRGKGSSYQITANQALLSAGKACYVYGDMMFLMCDEKYRKKTEITQEFAFQRAFYNATWLRLDPEKKLKLSATTLSKGCYFEMFRGCSGITSLSGVVMPTPAVALAPRCFDSMFYDCTGLTAVPEAFLPWTTLANGCYRLMFRGCTNLLTVPSGLLPATELKPYCYMNMFFNCYKLTAGPDLPATEPQSGCYFAMFRHCRAIRYVKCLVVLTTEQMSQTSNPNRTIYDDAAEPSPNTLDQWEVVSAWSVFNKWLNDVPNNASCTFVKHKDMTYPRNADVAGIPTAWTVIDYQ